MLQLLQKSMHNPVAVKMAFSAAMIVFIFILCISIMRAMRKQITEDRELTPFAAENSPGAALGAYQGVIAQLREEQRKLQSRHEEERQQMATARLIQEAVLANLNTGVLFLDRMGIVRQANPAAKTLLGYASPFGLHARDIFRGVTAVRATDFSAQAREKAGNVDWSLPGPDPLLAALASCSKEGISYRRLEAESKTPE